MISDNLVVQYPVEPKVEWTKIHYASVTVAILIWPCYWCLNPVICFACWPKFFSVAGLFLNTIGATIATLRPPFYGLFYDGGALQVRSEAIARKYFNCGMSIVVLGFVLQAIKEIA